jgi:hypothetical protein
MRRKWITTWYHPVLGKTLKAEVHWSTFGRTLWIMATRAKFTMPDGQPWDESKQRPVRDLKKGGWELKDWKKISS